MGFEVFLQGERDQTGQLPRKSDLVRVFDGYVIEDDTRPFGLPGRKQLTPHRLVVGNGGEECRVNYSDDGQPDPIQTSITVDRPLAATWLWECLFTLLRDYDLFMYWPSAEPVFVVARPNVPFPGGVDPRVVLVSSAQEVINTLQADA